MVEISAWTLLNATMPVVLMAALGYLFRRKDWVGQELQMGMMRLVIWLFTPALIVDRVLGNPLLRDFSVVWKVLLAGFLSIALGILISLWDARFLGLENGMRRRVFAYTTGIYNYGYLALPICLSLCPKETVGMMLLFNTGVELGIWTLGLAVVSGEINLKKILSAFTNPIFITMIAAQGLNFLGADSYVPVWVNAAAHSLGACMIPCGIMLVGMALPVLFNGFRFRDEIFVSLGAISLRLILIPAIMVCAALFLPQIPQDLRAILIIQSAMPPAMLPIVIVQYYGGDAKLALRIVITGTLACALTLPFWLKLGFWLLEKFPPLYLIHPKITRSYGNSKIHGNTTVPAPAPLREQINPQNIAHCYLAIPATSFILLPLPLDFLLTPQ